MAGEPNPFLDPDVSDYLDEKCARINELEAAIKAITYCMDGKVHNAWHDYVDLADKAPILRDVHECKPT
jgi:hypothetical protein